MSRKHNFATTQHQSEHEDEKTEKKQNHLPSGQYQKNSQLTPTNLRWMQRNIGNKATRRMIASQQPKSTTIQRQFADEALDELQFMAFPESAHEVAESTAKTPQQASNATSSAAIQRDLDLSSVRFLQMPDIYLSVMPIAPLNTKATTLMGSIREAGALSSSVQGSVSYLDYGAETGGRDLGAIRDVRDTLGSRARSDDNLRESMENFVTMNSEVSEKAHDFSGSLSGVTAATADLYRVVVLGQALNARREVATGTAAVAAVESRIATAKARAGTAVNVAADLFQANWTSAAVEVGKFLGNEILGAGIDAAYSPELTLAQTQLSESRTRLAGLEDEAQAHDLTRAAAALQQASSEAQRAKTALINKAQQADRAQTRLTNILDGMGMTEAVDALNARSSMMSTTSGAIAELQEYEDKVNTVKEQSTEVKEGNQMVIDFVTSGGGEVHIPDEDFRLALFSRADTNRDSARDVETWADGEPENISRLREELREGAFLTDYNQIVPELGQSLSN